VAQRLKLKDRLDGWSRRAFVTHGFAAAGLAGTLSKPSMVSTMTGPVLSGSLASKRTYAYMMADAVPKLLRSGFSKKEIHIFLVDNPRSFFCGV